MQQFDQQAVPSERNLSDDLSQTLKNELRQVIETRQIPNALLFYGANGTGKKEAALEFAKACNCTSSGVTPCNTCKSCKKINSGMHPDMFFLGPEDSKKTITIAQIREMSQAIASKPNEAAYRMVCITEAHLMNVQAQNSLLKVLEEPPENTFFILLVQDPAFLLSTILSRCRKFRFSPQVPEHMQQALCDGNAIDPELAHIICHTGGTAVQQALSFAKQGGTWKAEWTKSRTVLIQSILDLGSGGYHERIAKGLELSKKLCADPAGLSAALPVIRTVLRDLCVFAYDPETIVNLDFFDAFNDISQKHVYQTFLEWLTAFWETEKRLGSNSSERLALDRLFLEMSSS